MNSKAKWNDNFSKNNNEIFGNEDVISQLDTWLEDYQTKKKPLLIIGPSGCGKTNIAKQLLNKYNYHINYFNALDFANKNHIKDCFNKIINCYSVSIMTSVYKKSSIIIDEIEGINSYSKKHILNIINRIKKSKQKYIPPIICIGTGNYIKNVNELLKLCICIKIEKPNYKILRKKLDEIITSNNLNLSEKSINYVIENSQNDFRRLVHILKFLSYCDETTLKNLDQNINSLCDVILQKNFKDTELFIFTKILLSKKTSFADTLYFYSQEKVLLPLMIHQNIISYLYHNDNIDLDESLNILTTVYQMISDSDILGNYIYNNHYWNLSNAYAYLSCNVPSIILNSGKLSNKNTENLPGIVFTSILSRNSIKHVRKNQYDLLLRSIKNIHHVFDETKIMYISTIIIHYLVSADKDKNIIGLKLLKYYDINIKNISLLMRMSNIDKEKENYNRKKFINLKNLSLTIDYDK